MNLAPNIMDLLCHRAQDTAVLLTPGAHGLLRDQDIMTPFTEKRLTADDVLETLTALLGRLPAALMTLQREGYFAFGVPQFGRFHVAYITQRGSYAVRIARVPQGIPALADLLEAGQDAAVAARFMALRRGVLVVAGSDPQVANRLAYGLIGHLNHYASRVVYTLEPSLTYALKHDQGVVLQAEVGQDVPSVERGIDSALLVGAAVVYLRGLRHADDLRSAMRAATSGALVLISVAQIDLPLVLSGEPPLASSPLHLGVWRVVAGVSEDRVSVELPPVAP